MLTESTLNNVQCWGVGLAEKWISRYTEMDCYFCFQVFSFSFPFMPSSMAQLLLLTSLRESRQSKYVEYFKNSLSKILSGHL